jgi:hypothetical protein
LLGLTPARGARPHTVGDRRTQRTPLRCRGRWGAAVFRDPRRGADNTSEARRRSATAPRTDPSTVARGNGEPRLGRTGISWARPLGPSDTRAGVLRAGPACCPVEADGADLRRLSSGKVRQSSTGGSSFTTGFGGSAAAYPAAPKKSTDTKTQVAVRVDHGMSSRSPLATPDPRARESVPAAFGPSRASPRPTPKLRVLNRRRSPVRPLPQPTR